VGVRDAAAGQSAHPRGRRTDPGRGRKVVLITGTSSGFGRLTALMLAREGHEVYASMRHLQHRNAAAGRELRRVARTERLTLDVVDIDIRRERSVESGVRQVLRRAGRIDMLVNNAGIFYPALLETQTVAQIQEVFDTDVFGQLRMNRAALPTMRDQGEGLVVQITSGVGRIAFPFQGAYNGAKWAMEAMAQASRYELSQSGVDVVIVEPAAYPTDFIDNARIYYRNYLRRLSQATPVVGANTVSSRAASRTSSRSRPSPIPKRSPTRWPGWHARPPDGDRFARSSAIRSLRSRKSTPCTRESRTRSCARRATATSSGSSRNAADFEKTPVPPRASVAA
ncbi:MAG: SDR family oxidoreductase, partial [Thermoleophilaceae bacterium]